MDLFMMSLFLHLFGGYALVSIGVRMARNKGYTSPWPRVLLFATLACGLTLGIIALASITDSNELEAALVVLPLLLLLAEVVTICLLPRKRRVGGPRAVRFPWHKAGIALSILAGVCLIASAVIPGPANITLRVVFPLSMLALVSFQLAKRQALKPMEHILEDDNRPPVLYLRSFRSEESVFSERRRVGFLEFLRDAGKIQYGLPVDRFKTFEDFFSDTFKETIGPLVGLGNPTDYLPSEGAARTYQNDEHWQTALAELAERAACIVLPAFRASEGLSWELQCLKKQRLAGKLFILTCPCDRGLRPPGRTKGSRLILRRLFIAGPLTWISLQRPAPWHEFASFLRHAGYAVAVEDPGDGAVLAFDNEGNSSVIVTGAQTPSDYVNGINRHVKAQHRSLDAPYFPQNNEPARQPPLQGS